MNSLDRFSSGLRCVLIVVFFFPILLCCDHDDESPTPEVTALNPTSALPNTTISITGKAFSAVFSDNKVMFKGKEALVLNASASQLNVVVPTGAETGPVSVTVNGKAARNQPVFTVLSLPAVITNITPATGGYNTQVTITGSNFIPTPEANVVTFNGVPGTVTTASATSLTIKVPARAGSGVVVVNGVAAGVNFKYLPDVFVAGHVGDVNGNWRATYWKNGSPVTLSRPGQHTYAYDMAVVNDDIYVVGDRYLGIYSVARWWKNGTEMPLSDDKHFSSARAIHVVGTDVYIAGNEGNSANKTIAKYWKNGNAVNISDGTTNISLSGIVVNGQDVYTVGNSIHTNGNSVATYWKNGVANQLTTGISFAWNIFVSGNDVYTTGSIRNTGPGIGFVSYWKNNTAKLLSPGLNGGAGRDVVVVGDDIYVAGGEENVKDISVAKYWKNGAPVALSDGAFDAGANAIDVLGEDVYVAGYEYNAAGISIAKLWKNGVSIPITDGGYFATATALVLR
jgi:uncharacterized protein (TIGR03437 family)